MPSPQAKGRRTKIRGRLIALTLALSPFVLIELGLRMAGMSYPPVELPIAIWNPEEDDQLRAANALHRFDLFTMWAPRGEARIPWATDQTTSPGGFRGEDPDPEATVRVLVLGDSSTFGYGVRDEETYGEGLERVLEEAFPNERVQVLNGGIVGSTILQGLARYRSIRDRWQPQLVVEAFGAVNEHWPVVEMDDVEKLAFLREKESPLVKAKRGMREHLRLAHLAAFLSDRSRGGRQALLIELAEEGRARMQTAENYLEVPDYRRRVSPATFGEALAELREEVRADGATLVCVAMPRPRATEERLPPVLDYDPVLHRFAAETGVVLADVRSDFHLSGLSDDELFCDAYHPGPAGQARMARLLGRRILESELIRPGR